MICGGWISLLLVLLISSHFKTIKMNCQCCPMRTTMKQCVATLDPGVRKSAPSWAVFPWYACLLWFSVPRLYFFFSVLLLKWWQKALKYKGVSSSTIKKNNWNPGIWGHGLFLYLNVSTFCGRSKRVNLSLSTGVKSVVKLMVNSVFYESHHPSGFGALYCGRNRSSLWASL